MTRRLRRPAPWSTRSTQPPSNSFWLVGAGRPSPPGPGKRGPASSPQRCARCSWLQTRTMVMRSTTRSLASSSSLCVPSGSGGAGSRPQGRRGRSAHRSGPKWLPLGVRSLGKTRWPPRLLRPSSPRTSFAVGGPSSTPVEVAPMPPSLAGSPRPRRPFSARTPSRSPRRWSPAP